MYIFKNYMEYKGINKLSETLSTTKDSNFEDDIGTLFHYFNHFNLDMHEEYMFSQ